MEPDGQPRPHATSGVATLVLERQTDEASQSTVEARETEVVAVPVPRTSARVPSAATPSFGASAGLVRYIVLFVIDLGTRRVETAGIARQPHGAWMKRVARNLTDRDGFLKGMRYVIHDRDPLFTEEFRRILRDAGVNPIKLPGQSPRT